MSTVNCGHCRPQGPATPRGFPGDPPWNWQPGGGRWEWGGARRTTVQLLVACSSLLLGQSANHHLPIFARASAAASPRAGALLTAPGHKVSMPCPSSSPLLRGRLLRATICYFLCYYLKKTDRLASLLARPVPRLLQGIKCKTLFKRRRPRPALETPPRKMSALEDINRNR